VGAPERSTPRLFLGAGVDLGDLRGELLVGIDHMSHTTYVG